MRLYLIFLNRQRPYVNDVEINLQRRGPSRSHHRAPGRDSTAGCALGQALAHVLQQERRAEAHNRLEALGPLRGANREVQLGAERGPRVRRVPNADARVRSELARHRRRVPQALVAADQVILPKRQP